MKKIQLMNLVTLGEGFTTEFKRSGTSNLGREICAFANAIGGVILVGVADNCRGRRLMLDVRSLASLFVATSFAIYILKR